MLAGDGPPAAPCALQCEALKEEACHAPICTTGDRVQRVRLVTAHRPRPEAERSRLVTTERALLASCVTTGTAARNNHLFGWEISSPRSIAIYLSAPRSAAFFPRRGEAKRQRAHRARRRTERTKVTNVEQAGPAPNGDCGVRVQTACQRQHQQRSPR